VNPIHRESGFSLLELLMAMALLLVVSGIATTALMQMTTSQSTIWNRTQMHSGIRGATELLQQEVGQAGRLGLSANVSLNAPVTAAPTCDPGTPTLNAVTVAVVSRDDAGNIVTLVNGVNPLRGLFADAAGPAYILLTTMDGDQQESFRLASVDPGGSTITACFTKNHAAGTLVLPLGSFATGIIPPSGIANPSTGSVLKLYGDINGDGNMVYVEYTCDPLVPGNPPTSAPPGTGNLYRNVMPYDTAAASKPALSNAQILLSNILPNPGGTPCFTYQFTNPALMVQGTLFTFVLDVAITLTVQTEQIDPLTRQFETETKALLNVSPRNIFNAWMLAGMGYTDRIQSTPATVMALLP
jgi:prepilin-type N-terminal cleavage/methylation domain-containing protein